MWKKIERIETKTKTKGKRTKTRSGLYFFSLEIKREQKKNKENCREFNFLSKRRYLNICNGKREVQETKNETMIETVSKVAIPQGLEALMGRVEAFYDPFRDLVRDLAYDLAPKKVFTYL